MHGAAQHVLATADLKYTFLSVHPSGFGRHLATGQPERDAGPVTLSHVCAFWHTQYPLAHELTSSPFLESFALPSQLRPSAHGIVWYPRHSSPSLGAAVGRSVVEVSDKSVFPKPIASTSSSQRSRPNPPRQGVFPYKAIPKRAGAMAAFVFPHCPHVFWHAPPHSPHSFLFL